MSLKDIIQKCGNRLVIKILASGFNATNEFAIWLDEKLYPDGFAINKKSLDSYRDAVSDANVLSFSLVEIEKPSKMGTVNPPAVQNFSAIVEAIKAQTKITIELSGYSIEAELHVDGNMFGIIACGDLQTGIAAFGPTIESAVRSFKQSCLSENPKVFGQE